MANILVVDDELGIRELSVGNPHRRRSLPSSWPRTPPRRARLRERQRPDLVLLDIWMPDADGITLLKEWYTGGQLTMPVIMMSGHGTIDTAVEATQHRRDGLPGKADHAAEAAARRSSRAWPSSPAARPPRLPASPGPGPMPMRRLRLKPVPPPSEPRASQFDFDLPLREARDAFERAYFEFHLVQEHGSMTRVAEKTGLERTHLYRKLKQLGIDLSKTKRGGRGEKIRRKSPL